MSHVDSKKLRCIPCGYLSILMSVLMPHIKSKTSFMMCYLFLRIEREHLGSNISKLKDIAKGPYPDHYVS